MIDCFSFAAQVTGRGCSTKDKVFYRECETHSYGDQIEKMCFCSFFLCNGGASSTVKPSLIILLTSLAFCSALHQLLAAVTSADFSCCDSLQPVHPPASSVSKVAGLKTANTVMGSNRTHCSRIEAGSLPAKESLNRTAHVIRCSTAARSKDNQRQITMPCSLSV